MASSLNYTDRRALQQEAANAPIVEGNFPSFEQYKEKAISKLNKVLISLLLTTVVISLVSYSAVVAKENALKSIHKETTDLNYENLDLQNKVDYVKSFYNIDKNVSKTNVLQKADSVIEVADITPPVDQKTDRQDLKFNTVLGY